MTPLELMLVTPLSQLASASAKRPFDAVVVGGGPSGLTSARTLAERGCTVAVLEAGPLVLLSHASSTDLRFAGDSVRALQNALSYSPQNADGSTFGNLVSCLGGRGLFWNGAAPRFLATDFRRWPLSLGDLEESYQWAERELFVSRAWGRTAVGRQTVRRLRQAGLPAQPEPFAIDSARSINGQLSGTIGNPLTSLLRSGVAQRDPDSRRLHLATNAFAVAIDRASRRHLRVEVNDIAEGKRHRVACRTLVLAAGGFESVRLAISSELPDESGLMGRRLVDHWFVRGYFPLPPDYYPRHSPSAAAAIVRPGHARPYQVEVHLPARRFFTAAGGTANWQPDGSEAYGAMVRAFAPTKSQDEAHLEVTAGARRGGYRVHMPVTGADRELTEQMRTGVDEARRALGAAAAAVDVYPLGASYHEAGGLAMGPSPATGVTDSAGRAWGDRRIRVFDAAAWPSIGCANPHLTLVAIARRNAGILAADLVAST